MAVITRKSDLPLRARLIAEKIEAHGYRWTFDYEFPLDKIDPGRRGQVRKQSRNVPMGQRTRYARSMRNGAQFPPGVLTADFFTVDGNTRFAAMRDCKIKTASVFILQDRYEDASRERQVEQHVQANIVLLGLDLNQENGQPMHDDDLHDVFVSALLDGHNVDSLADGYAVERAYLTNLSNEAETIKRAIKEGLVAEREELYTRLNQGQMRALGTAGKHVLVKPWVSLFKLVRDADMPEPDITSYVTRLRTLPTEEEMLADIEGERVARQKEITAVAAGGRGRSAPSGNVRRGGGLVIKQAKDPRRAAEHNPHAAEGHTAMLYELREAVDELIEEQEKVNEEMRLGVGLGV